MDFYGKAHTRFAPLLVHTPSIPSWRIMDEYTREAVGLLVLPAILPLIAPTIPEEENATDHR